MSSLSSLDLAIVAAYIVGMTLFGVWFTRKQNDLRMYFLGGRLLGWLLVLMSIVLTIVYPFLVGMKAVIWTDLIQFLIKITGAVLAGVFVLYLLPGGWDEFVAAGDAAGRFKMIEWNFDLASPFNLYAGVLGG